MNHQLIINYSRICYASFFYQNQLGESVRIKPRKPTIHGVEVGDDLCAHSQESRLARAKRLGMLDNWTPVCKFRFSHGHTLTFKGEDAKKQWKEYGRFTYKKE